MKKITYLVINDISHDPRVNKEISVALNCGFDVSVLCLNPYKQEAKNFSIIDIGFGFIEKAKTASARSSLPNSSKKESYLSKKDILRIIRMFVYNLNMIKKGFFMKEDIIHANDLNTLFAGYILSRLHGSKLIYDAHEIYSEQFADGTILFKSFLLSLEKLLINKPQSIITVNSSIANWFTTKYKVKLPYVVMNAVQKRYILSKKEWVPGKIKGIYIGMLHPERGIEELVLSMKGHNNIELYIQGDGSIKELLKDLCKDIPNVFFLDSVPLSEMVCSLKSYDFGVIPYKPVCLNNLYSMPNKLFEYMSAGLALFVSDLPELRKVVLGNNIGFVFEAGNISDISSKLEMFDKKDLYNKGVHSLYYATNLYNWELEGTKLKDIYLRGD